MTKTVFATIIIAIALAVGGQAMAGGKATHAPSLEEQSAAQRRIAEAYLKGTVAGMMQEAIEEARGLYRYKPPVRCRSQRIGDTVYTDCD
jgi:hypothetical protein